MGREPQPLQRYQLVITTLLANGVMKLHFICACIVNLPAEILFDLVGQLEHDDRAPMKNGHRTIYIS